MLKRTLLVGATQAFVDQAEIEPGARGYFNGGPGDSGHVDLNGWRSDKMRIA
jgi:hypothetical protein